MSVLPYLDSVFVLGAYEDYRAALLLAGPSTSTSSSYPSAESSSSSRSRHRRRRKTLRDLLLSGQLVEVLELYPSEESGENQNQIEEAGAPG